MKKLLVTLLIMTMSVSLFVGCGGSDDADKGNDTAVNQEADANDDVDEEEEEYIDPRLELTVDADSLLQYVTEIEITVDNWSEYFTIAEETSEDGGERASKTLYINLNDGYYLKEDVEIILSYDKKTTSTSTIPEYGPDTNIFNDHIDDSTIEISNWGNRGIISSTYIYDELDDGVTNELVIEISNIQCSAVTGKIYSLQLPEEVWQDEDGTQMIYLKYVSEDGDEFVMEYENTPEDLNDLWDEINNY